MTQTDTPAKPRRWPRRLLLSFLFVVGLVIAVPWIAAALAPALVTNELEKRLNARATLDDVDLSYAGRVAVRGFDLEDLEGRPLLSVARVDVDADVRSALKGLYKARIDVDGFEVHVRRGEDGSINLADVVRPRPDDGDDGDDDGSSGKSGDEPPSVFATVRVRNGRVVIHGADGTTELVDLTLSADVIDLAKPVEFEAGLGVRGPGGDGGTVQVSGAAIPLPAKGDQTPRANAKLKVEALLLDALAPALALFLPDGAPRGRVDVDLDVELLKSLAVRGGGDIRVTDLEIPAGREGAPAVRFDAVTVTSRAALEQDLSGTQSVKVEVDDFLALEYSGAVKRSGDDGMDLDGKVTVDGSLARLAEVAGAFVPLRDDVHVAGRLSSTSDFSITTGDEGLRRGSFTTSTTLDELAATGPDGPLDLGSLKEVRVGLTAEADLDAGTARLDGLDARLGPVHVRGHAAATGIDATAPDPDKVRLEDSRFEIDADLDRLVRDLRPIVDLGDQGIAGDLSVVASAKQDGEHLTLTADVTPTGLTAGGLTIDATPLSIAATVTPLKDRIDARASVETDRLSVTLADGRQLAQRRVRIRADLEQKTSNDVITVRDAGYRSDTAEVDVTGRVLAATDPDNRTIELGVDLRTALETLRRDLAAFLDGLPYEGRATIASHVDVRVSGDDVRADSKTTLRDLDLTVAAKDAGKPPLRITEPSVELALTTTLAQETGRIDIERLDLDSGLLRGTLSGGVDGAIPPRAGLPEGAVSSIVLDRVRGEFFYIPDRLGELLAPYLPAELKGAAEERVTLELDGRLDDFDPLTLLESSKGGVRVGLGTLLLPGIETGGDVALELAEGRVSLTGDLGANGGKIDLLGDLGTSDAAKAGSGAAMLKLDVTDFAVNAQLGQLLSLASPVFSSVDGLNENKLGGVLGCKVQLGYGEPLTLQRLARDWQTLDPRLLEGSVHFQIDEAMIEGSSLLSELLDKIGVPVGEELSISPVDLTIGGGKLTYAEPWKWKFGDIKTNFTGSVDFDRTLDLGWNIPITKKLVKKYDFLKSLKGESIAVPLTGTTSNPNLQFDGVLTQLAQKAAKSKIDEKLGGLGDKIPGGLGDKIPGLDDILGGGDKKPDVPTPSPDAPTDPDAPAAEPAEVMPTDPAELLKRADALWNAGEEKSARKFYRELRKSHQLTLIFQLNKDRIEDRAKKKGKN